ncbi:MAG: site-2 protease family protein [Holosporaceae bacterium]|jgi:Zn-dependent protease|nr:site-2 protease family protein [Holosporaceae bacterium]
MQTIIDTLLIILLLLVAIALHEMSHAVVAYALGDDTAKKAGRFKLHTHFDLYGCFLIPALLYFCHSPIIFGYAKPVPVDTRKFEKPLMDMALVAAAGPLCNLLLAALGAWVFSCTVGTNNLIMHYGFDFMMVNLTLCLFNLIPIPPLDGSRIMAAIVPESIARKMLKIEPFGFFIIIGIEITCSQLSSILGYRIGMSAVVYNLLEKILAYLV